ncbi:MAG: hypothetical protein AAGF12_24670 [Myxococcota bacterium]
MRTISWVLLTALWAGCGASAAPVGDTFHPRLAVTLDDFEPTAEPGSRAESAPDPNLPASPWEGETVTSAPNELLQAWHRADNREWCAPIAPSVLRGDARPAQYQGGWAVEFDQDGMPGVSRNGRVCSDCGRGAWGIAGTGVMVDDEDPMEAEERAFRDGSRVRVESFAEEGEFNAHAATIKIAGQDCVYQVWSFVGDEHLEELIEELRFVEAETAE